MTGSPAFFQASSPPSIMNASHTRLTFPSRRSALAAVRAPVLQWKMTGWPACTARAASLSFDKVGGQHLPKSGGHGIYYAGYAILSHQSVHYCLVALQTHIRAP